ncbi:hypothetical protein Bbelb_050790 [Branchiostoma belcheri]|nr:hypothetical protein Bbelb_050790 [Branchiostoma belcheri]
MAIPGSLEKRQRLTDDSGDQTSLTDLLHTCIKETRELDSQTESAVLGLHDHTAPTEPEAQSPKSGFPGGWTAVKIDLTLSKLDVLPEASQHTVLARGHVNKIIHHRCQPRSAFQILNIEQPDIAAPTSHHRPASPTEAGSVCDGIF